MAKIKDINDMRYVCFTAEAYTKMMFLVNSLSSEIGWRGTVERLPGPVYLIKDIMLYPQTVAATTVDTDETKLSEWTNTLSIDTINTMRFQGHSHVDMGVYASSVDEADQKTTVEQIRDDDYYIFAIANKRNDLYLKIYEKNDGKMKEIKSDDISYNVLFNGDETLVSFANDIKEKVEEEKVAYTPSRFYSKPYIVAGKDDDKKDDKDDDDADVNLVPPSYANYDYDDPYNDYGYGYGYGYGGYGGHVPTGSAKDWSDDFWEDTDKDDKNTKKLIKKKKEASGR